MNKSDLLAMSYFVLPHKQDKMYKIFAKFNLEWDFEGWNEGEMEGRLIGTRGNLVKFLRGGGYSKKNAEQEIQEMTKPYEG